MNHFSIKLYYILHFLPWSSRTENLFYLYFLLCTAVLFSLINHFFKKYYMTKPEISLTPANLVKIL